jgi:hypothetical protein
MHILTLRSSERHPRFSNLVDVVTSEIIHRRNTHPSRFGHPSSLPHHPAGPFTWLSRDTSSDSRLSDNRATGRQHDSSEIRRPGRDRPGPNQFHAEPTRAPRKGPNDNHHSHSNSDTHPPAHTDCDHAYDFALSILRSRLPKHCSICVRIRYIHTHSGFVLPELWINDHGLLVLVWRRLWTGGNRWEGDTYSHYHGGSGAGVSASGRNVSAATTQGGREYDVEYSHKGRMGRGGGNNNICDPSGITKSSEEWSASDIEVDGWTCFSVLF